jgi:hypothetical protein
MPVRPKGEPHSGPFERCSTRVGFGQVESQTCTEIRPGDIVVKLLASVIYG